MPRLEDTLRRLDEEREAEARARWRPFFLVLLLVGAGAGAWWWFWGRHSPPPEATLPVVLVTPPSAARRDLSVLGREEFDLASEVDHEGKRGLAALKKSAAAFAERLRRLHKVGRDLEPKLSREEQRILMGMQWGEKLVDGYVQDAIAGRTPDPKQIAAALDQLQRARDLAAGKKVDNLIVSYARTVLAGTEKGGALSQISGNLDSIKENRGRMNAELQKAMQEADAATAPSKKKGR